MLSDPERIVLEKYIQDLLSLVKESRHIEQKIDGIRASVLSILALHADIEAAPYLEQIDALFKPEGFTEAIRKVLRSTNAPLTPSEVKENLPEVGFDLDGYSNPLASVHTILKRLAKTELVEQRIEKDRTTYRWLREGEPKIIYFDEDDPIEMVRNVLARPPKKRNKTLADLK